MQEKTVLASRSAEGFYEKTGFFPTDDRQTIKGILCRLRVGLSSAFGAWFLLEPKSFFIKFYSLFLQICVKKASKQ